MAQEAAIPAAPLKKRATMFNLLPNTASACRPRIQPTVAAKFPPAQRGPTGSAGQVAPRGLTLIELLVAVALIGILAALAVPGLAAAKRAARKTACLNNLKQLQLCWHLYVTDHDDAVPPNRSLMTNGVWRSTPDSWIGFSSAPHDADTRAIEQGLLYRYDYNREVRIYHCPEDRSTVRGLTRPRTRSYSMNGAFGGRKEDKQPVVIQRAGEVRNPAQAFVFLDEHEDSIDDAHFLVWPAPDTRWVNVPADRHSRGGTFSFADGHVEHWKWQWPKSRRGWPTYYKEAENEADLADLQRLQAALPNAE